jgi:signal transduction histidine kinase
MMTKIRSIATNAPAAPACPFQATEKSHQKNAKMSDLKETISSSMNELRALIADLSAKQDERFKERAKREDARRFEERAKREDG